MSKQNNHVVSESIDAVASLWSADMGAVGYTSGDGLGAIIDRLKGVAARLRAHRPGFGLEHVTNFLRSFNGRADWAGEPRLRRKMAVKYIVRAIGMPWRHVRYLSFVYGNPPMCAYQRRDPRLLERHFHRYIHLQWSRSARLRSVQQHYRFALARLPKTLFEAIYVYGNATLGNVTLKDGTQLKLCLRPPIHRGCEGELCLQLSDADDFPIYRLILTVIDDRPTIAIGCLQGPEGQNGKDIVRDLTKNMYGMRPKQLMLSLAYAFAQRFGIERILAVSNMAHPLRRARDRFQADYDEFWLEQKGCNVGHGWFMLPETLSRKSEADVPSKHRSAFRRREAIRLEAEQLLIDALAAYPPRRDMAPLVEELESARSFQHDGLEVSWTR
ncbi:hypothetical protein HDE76_003451 [Rhodanobacter sp. ANJX3]|uniref:DUF535 family protein n=1 Tax=Rhodanobacter sp. ANJX3 TaxID=2723083 RepID=UPI001622AA5B|nr:hypothetical protein [Rhodanobacter sp. ANJX3]